MKNIITTVFFLLVVIVGLVILSSRKPEESAVLTTPAPTDTLGRIKTMKIESSAFQNNQLIPVKYTCDGQNINPPLAFSDIPAGTKSLVLMMDDPDAPMGTWVHWTVWNIDPQTKTIDEKSIPTGVVEGMTSFGKPGYDGPCPPDREHRYFFKLYALNTLLNLEKTATKGDLEKAMAGHILTNSELIGRYNRSSRVIP